jgi:hypothetical protein
MESETIINFLHECGIHSATAELVNDINIIFIEELVDARLRFIKRVQEKVQAIHIGEAGPTKRNGGYEEALEITASVQSCGQ